MERPRSIESEIADELRDIAKDLRECRERIEAYLEERAREREAQQGGAS